MGGGGGGSIYQGADPIDRFRISACLHLQQFDYCRRVFRFLVRKPCRMGFGVMGWKIYSCGALQENTKWKCWRWTGIIWSLHEDIELHDAIQQIQKQGNHCISENVRKCLNTNLCTSIKTFSSGFSTKVVFYGWMLPHAQKELLWISLCTKPIQAVYSTHILMTWKSVKSDEHDQLSFRLLMQKKLHKFELASLANLCPESADEAKALVPRWDLVAFSLFKPRAPRSDLSENHHAVVVVVIVVVVGVDGAGGETPHPPSAWNPPSARLQRWKAPLFIRPLRFSESSGLSESHCRHRRRITTPARW